LKVALASSIDIKYSYQGVPYHIYEYAKFLKDNNIDTSLIIPKAKIEPPTIKNYKAVRRRYNEVPKRFVDRPEISLPLWHPVIYRSLPEDSIIYFPNSIYDSIINILTKPRGQKYVIGCHNMFIIKGSRTSELLKWLRNTLIRGILLTKKREFDNIYFHVINKVQGSYLTRVFNVNPRNIFYVPPMIDAQSYKIKRNNSAKLKVLHIGGYNKNISIVLDIVSELYKKNILSKFKFYFVGDRNFDLESQYAGFRDVHFLGPISDKDKFKVMSEMDVMIVPGSECFSKTMLEGMASGLYILTSRKNGAWKDVTDLNTNVVITRTNSVEEYIPHLIKLLKDKNSKAFLKAKVQNRDIAIKNFDKTVLLPKILKMFLDIASG
jgi:glycosyltransferase involved in cell wall biosynthesis